MERRAITVQGTVQGVGFRPFVYGLASQLGLHGFVRNATGGVQIEVEGESNSLDQFLLQLTERHPPLAHIDELAWQPQSPRGDEKFQIRQSDPSAAGDIVISSDVATCDDCLAELFDRADRRHGYPFLNCTNCGPRLTIIRGAPYDRHRTTMSPFTMCPACRDEYEDPANRRFHAQPIACPKCGPRLEALDAQGDAIAANDPLQHFARCIKAGKIGAMKGLGGYHLVCDAANAQAVAELRRRKHRDEKPLAVMARDISSARAFCGIDRAEANLLSSSRRPIVLLRKKDGTNVAEEVAPRNPFIGVMLPYTPLHHLLMQAVDGAPLVMTSGNRSDEPIAYQDADAIQRLHGIADVFLIHNREIHLRCDDSVTRVIDGEESPVRRSRGYAPQPIRLPMKCATPILAVGGQFKATFALARDRQAVLSHHLGDLDHFQAYQAFEKDIALYEALFEITPQIIAHDLHPDYASTHYARRRQPNDLQLLPVQHHHAHMASCMAEHGLNEPVIGVTLDGTGFGTDRAIWGGEILIGDYQKFHRAAHLRYVPMPGSAQAIHEPWRMALSHLLDADCSTATLLPRISDASLRAAAKMIERKFNAPMTSSAGRLFDAVASLIGLCDRVSYEGQAAMELEWLASDVRADGAYPFELLETRSSQTDEPMLIADTRPLIRAVVADLTRGQEPSRIARRFHSTMVDLISIACGQISDCTGLKKIVLSGGVFMNALVTEELTTRLATQGFQVYRHRKVPTNDGGLSLGQLAVAAATSMTERSRQCALASPAK